ncbi:MAG TPA: large conductance mechanosensitive channel protein MscL [Anaerolineaceae bacterium]|nr:large conductance mechanosensitive channel protein MscL [Anaerolineaceae bacterium]
MWQEFKKFLAQGNVIDLAVAVIMGTAFGAVVTSLVEDVIMPPIGLLLGGVDFSNLFINLSGTPYASLAEAQAAGAPTINYGMFLNTVINFLIVAAAVFLMIRGLKATQRGKEEQGAVTKDCPYCYSTIPIQATRCPECTSQLAGD